MAKLGDGDLVRLRRSFGEGELLVCSDGPFLLDGGAMFGVVPKTLWQKRLPANAENQVQLGLNTVVFRTGAHIVVIETGIGNKQPAKLRAIHANRELLPKSLQAADVQLDEVTHVINTHLHFDHCGWNTTLQPDGKVRPTFPNARYFAPAGELAHGRLQLDRDAVSYRGANYDSVIATGQLTLIDPHGAGGYTSEDQRLQVSSGGAGQEDAGMLPPISIQTTMEIVPGVRLEPYPGHTADLLGVHLEARSHGGAHEHACYISDLMPTHHHADPTWVMGFDLDPLQCIAERKRFLAQAIPGEWLVLFTHDHRVPAARLAWNDRGKPIATPVSSQAR